MKVTLTMIIEPSKTALVVVRVARDEKNESSKSVDKSYRYEIEFMKHLITLAV